MRGFHKLRIDADSPVGFAATVELDGRPLYVRELTLHMAPDEITTVDLTIEACQLEITAAAWAALEAYVVDREANSIQEDQ